MIKLKTLILSEAILNKSEFDAALSKSEIQYVTVEMDKNGKVYFSPDFDSKLKSDDRKTSLVLNFKTNKVIARFDSLGNKINASMHQLLRQLIKDNIINDTWTLSFNDDIGLYKQGVYTKVDGSFSDLPLNFWSRNKSIDLHDNLTLYHGTSSKDLPSILKYGLQPLGRKYATAGYSSRIRTPDNRDFLYLTTSFRRAYQYAKDRASSLMRSEDKDKWEYTQHRDIEYWFIQPVVLEVTVPDFTKLRSDDDMVISLMKDKARELWSQFPPEVQDQEWEKTKEWFQRVAGFVPTESNKGAYYWIMSDNGLKYVLDRFDRSAWDNWKASIKNNEQVAYKGFIPPRFIKIKEI